MLTIFLTKQTQISNKNLNTKDFLSRYDHGQLNILMSKKEYKIFASKDKYWYIN